MSDDALPWWIKQSADDYLIESVTYK